MRHADPRVYIGPKTNELVVSLGRSYGVDMVNSHPNVTMTVKRTGYTADWVSYGVDDSGYAHFQIPDAFMAEAPKGFYKASMSIAGCEVARIEMIKAPSYYARDAKTATTECKTTKWVEPECVEAAKQECGCDCNGSLTVGCHCGFYFRDQCPSCSVTYITVKVASRDGYGLTDVENCAPDIESITELRYD